MKRTIGFPINKKENERRRAIVPPDLSKIKNRDHLYFQHGYGNVLGYSDDDYAAVHGVHMVDREEALKKDIICDPKIGDAEYLTSLHNQTIFGWLHAVQNKPIRNAIIRGGLTAFAWEDMFEGGRHVFWRNNEIAGEAAIMHAFQCYGQMPYDAKVALIGRGNVGSGSLKILTLLGANVTVYSRKMDALLRRELPNYDVIVNAILWDSSRNDHIIYHEDLKRMKKGAMIIDISCDRNGGIESSIPTTIQDPVYSEGGILHYVVDHTPSLFYKTASANISSAVYSYIDRLIEGDINDVLRNALYAKNGVVLNNRTIK